MRTRAKNLRENLHFDDQTKQMVLLFSSLYFLKEIEKKYSVVLPSYRNNRETLGELEKAVPKHSSNGSCSHSISRSPKLSLVFLLNN